MQMTIKMRGTCGEFVQGFYRGEPLIITCPIQKFSTVTVSDEFTGVEGLGEKSLAMLAKVLRLFGVEEFNFGLRLTSELPRGKGMASSSADVAAVAKAASLALGKELSAAEIGSLAAEIEPTDGVYFEGVVAMNPLTGQLVKKISVPENFSVAVFDYGGEVDTLNFNRRSGFKIDALPNTLDFEQVRRSALANQEILPKHGLRELMNFADELGAAAVNVAHSGTVAGIFFRAYDSALAAKVRAIQGRFDFINLLTITELS